VVLLSLGMAVSASLLTAFLVVYSRKDTFLYAIGKAKEQLRRAFEKS
jgi:hypothetical protein